VPSSTSSYRLATLDGRWLAPLSIALLLATGFVAWMEWRLADKGFVATAIDSEALWMKERTRATRLGSQGLIIVGASRIQLGVDLPTLREATGLEPVQLAIDGSGYLPILEGLARDPTISGTVLVDYYDSPEPASPVADTADMFQKHYDARATESPLPDFAASEARLGDIVHSKLRSYADGARPVTSLLMRVLPSGETPQYLVTLPDRSRIADYDRVPMPRFYLNRVARNFGLPPPSPDLDDATLKAQLAAYVETLTPQQAPYNDRRYRRILAATHRIEARGGRVLFFVMPTSKMVWRGSQLQFPRDRFYDPFAAAAAPRAHHWHDNPGMRGFVTPDGSHLDKRDRVAFTRILVEELQLGREAREPEGLTSPPAANPNPAPPVRSP